MNVVKLMGGLGNQLFQYAFGQHVQEVTGRPVRYNTSWYNVERIPPRPYRLNKFEMVVGAISYDKYKIVKEKDSLASLASMDSRHFHGYWQDPRFYNEILLERLRNEFHVKQEFWTKEFTEWYEYINLSKNAVALHVRRGDYLHHPDHLVLTLRYYQKALAYMQAIKTDPEIFVFSDDIEWCKEQFEDVHFVELPEDFLQFELIRACKHFIIANSTFSWWAAFLAYGATVIAPNQWNKTRLNGSEVHERNMLSPPWMYINLL